MQECIRPLTFWFSPAGGATIALVGVVLTGLVTWWLSGRTRRWQLEDDFRNRLLQRGEEAYSLVRNWYLDQHHWYLHHRLVMEGRVDYNSALDAVIEQGGARSLQVERVHLILDVYFPKISPIWKEAVSAIQGASAINSDFRAAYEDGLLSSETHRIEFDRAFIETEQRVDRTLKELTHAIKGIAKA